jgi:hypothetical protein
MDGTAMVVPVSARYVAPDVFHPASGSIGDGSASR